MIQDTEILNKLESLKRFEFKSDTYENIYFTYKNDNHLLIFLKNKSAPISMALFNLNSDRISVEYLMSRYSSLYWYRDCFEFFNIKRFDGQFVTFNGVELNNDSEFNLSNAFNAMNQELKLFFIFNKDLFIMDKK